MSPKVLKAIEEFKRGDPLYKKMLDDRINDLLNFPELIWASAVIDREDSNKAEFVTYHQKVDLAGTVTRETKIVLITFFEFHH